jgi:pyruvate/2-oxoacid:ferredoxin oxidoreductase alpha subunit
MLERLPAARGIVLQGEDEIAAIGYCLGASMAGMKAMTATSGPFLPFGVKEGEEVPAFLPIGGSIPVRQTSSTHGANEYITTNPSEIQAGVERLKNKIESHVASFTFSDLEQREGAHTLIVTYGITARAARAAAAAVLN